MSDGKEDMQLGNIAGMLSSTYWAQQRSLEEIESSMHQSHCFGLFKESQQVGFARIVTDGVSVYWLCDVVIHINHRGKGLGKVFLDFILKDHMYSGLGILMTRDAHDLYEQYGYQINKDNFMMKP